MNSGTATGSHQQPFERRCPDLLQLALLVQLLVEMVNGRSTFFYKQLALLVQLLVPKCLGAARALVTS